MRIYLKRKALNSNSNEINKWIDNIINLLINSKYLDDTTYAINRATSLIRKGKPSKFIFLDLTSKHIDKLTIMEAIKYLKINNSEYDDIDYLAADNYAKKKNLGKFAISKPKNVNKQIEKMVRAGFSYDISKKTLDCSFDFD